MGDLFATHIFFEAQLGTLNKVTDGLSKRVSLLLKMKSSVGGFDEFRTFYAVDPYLSNIFMALQRGDGAAHPSYMLKDGFPNIWHETSISSSSSSSLSHFNNQMQAPSTR